MSVSQPLITEKEYDNFVSKVVVGQKVEFVSSCDCFPQTVVCVGETGTIVVVTNTMVSIKLDKHHEALGEWDNELHYYIVKEVETSRDITELKEMMGDFRYIN